MKREKAMGVSFLKVACRDMDLLNYVSHIVPPEVFDYEPHREIFRYLLICLDEDSPPDKEDAIEFFDPKSYKEFLKIMSDPEVVEEITQTDIDNAIYLEFDDYKVKKAADDALDQMLRKMYDKEYLSTRRNHDIVSYENAQEIFCDLNDIQQSAEN